MPSSDAVIGQLNAHMGIPEALRFDAGQGGLVRAVMTAGGAEAHVYLHGAHLLHFQPTGQPPLLFASKASRFEAGKPIRGGVPICFPWFGPKAGDANAPMHGFARDRNWKFKTVERLPDGSVTVVLVLKWTAALLQLWPHRFTATQTVTLDARGDRVTMELAVKNLGGPAAGEPGDAPQNMVESATSPFKFEAALHTYFTVGGVQQVSITGLENATFIDKTDNFARKQQPAEPVRITGETDRVFVDATGPATIHDPALKRRIVIEKSNSSSTVVWNPWINKAKAMADFGDDEWPDMLCIETANVADNAVTLKPKQSHVMKATIRVEGM